MRSRFRSPHQRLRRAYIAALIALALVSIAGHIALERFISRLASDATLINVAGRQRMLSQRIALLAHHYADERAAGHMPDPEAIRAALELWTQSHRALRDRDGTLGLCEPSSQELHRALLSLEPDLHAAAETAGALLALPEAQSDRANTLSDEITLHTERFLPQMHALVGGYELEASGAVRIAERAEFVFLIGHLVLLGLLAGLVFEPAAREIHRQHRALTDSHRHRDQLARIVELTTNSAVMTDPQGRITWVNSAFINLTGFTREEALGRTPGSFLQCAGTNPTTIKEIRAALAMRKPFRGEILNRAKDGREYWITLDIQPHHDENGALVGFIAIQSDITEQVSTRERLRSIFTATADGIVVLNAQGEIIDCNPAAERVFGLTADQILGRTPRDPRWEPVREDGTHFPPDEHPATRTLATGTPFRNFIHGIRASDGSRRWISVSTEPIRNADGSISAVVASVQDLTAAREQQRRLELIVRGAGLGTWDWNVATGAVDFNDRWFTMLGYAPGELPPNVSSWELLVHPDDKPNIMRVLTDHLEGRTPEYRCEHRLRRKDGTWAWVLDAGQVVERDVHGRALQATGVHVDISLTKRAEQELEKARSAAEAASAAKSEFLANMSHEIRTPMTAILGFTEVLANDAQLPRERQLEHIETIRRNGEHLLSIINDILDLSKIEAGKMTVEHTRTSPAQVVHEVLSLMQVKAAAKGLELSAALATPVPQLIESDPIRLRQILVNLVGNAVKFTETGAVRVEVRADPNDGCLSFEVVDSGIGMSDEARARLFQPFAQADTSTTRRFGGTGLGLRISQRLAQMLGGDIDVHSAPGRGSRFTLRIHADPAPGAPMLPPEDPLVSVCAERTNPSALAPAHSDRPLEGLRILLAEDGPDNQRLISFHLRKAGASVRIVSNGLEAVRALCANEDDAAPLVDPPPFDLLLSDMQMPEMDGYAAARLLRTRHSRLPIVALTAHAMSGDAQRCLDAGCDAYASKPIDRAELIRTCLEAVQRRAA
ncbi:MAG: PAS domain S-box protein [Planctomycetota bacterium]|nr:PAS domain S-box protein [Planctomycetota bacterium]